MLLFLKECDVVKPTFVPQNVLFLLTYQEKLRDLAL